MRIFAALLLLWPQTSLAGAWLRDEGGWFTSMASEFGDSGLEDNTSLYLEYGLTEEMTLTLDTSYSHEFGLNHARLFLRRPAFTIGPHVFSYTTGFGYGSQTITVEEPVFATVGTTRVFVGNIENTVTDEGYEALAGASWGMGRDGGWVNVDATAIWLSALDTVTTKVDATYGWNRGDWLAIAQVQTAFDDTETSVRFAPSYVRRLTDVFRLETGLSIPVGEDGETRVKLGVWVEF